MKNRIYIKEWLHMKPYSKQAPTDFYYLNLTNDIHQALVKSDLDLFISEINGEEGLANVCCALASYIEDLVSGTNVWNTFLRCHRKQYGKWLPFYPTDEYFEGEPNWQDVAFLLWYVVSIGDKDGFNNPHYRFYETAAVELIELLGRAYEEAPENETLRACYLLDEDLDDYYPIQGLLDKILSSTYLFCLDTGVLMLDQGLDLIKERREDPNLPMILYETRIGFTHTSGTKLMAMAANEWAAEILGEDHALSNSIRALSKRVSGFFFYKGQDAESIHLVHIASGKVFSLVKRSFDSHEEMDEVDEIWYLGMVQWKDEWWFSGISFNKPFDADFVLDLKNSVPQRAMVGFLDDDDRMRELLEEQYQQFLVFNGGLPVAFMPSDEVGGFINDVMDDYNLSLNQTAEEKEAAIARSRRDGLRDVGKLKASDFANVSADEALVFFNPKAGIQISFGVNSAFPIDGNPYFKEDESEEDISFLISSKDLSTELAMYCIDNFKDRLPFFQQVKGMKYLDDMDFLLRFFKAESYYSKPEMTLVGKGQ